MWLAFSMLCFKDQHSKNALGFGQVGTKQVLLAVRCHDRSEPVTGSNGMCGYVAATVLELHALRQIPWIVVHSYCRLGELQALSVFLVSV